MVSRFVVANVARREGRAPQGVRRCANWVILIAHN